MPRLIDILASRPTVLLKKPLVYRIFKSSRISEQLMVYGVWLDGEIKSMEEKKKREWTARGIEKHWQQMATKLAKEWAESMMYYNRELLLGAGLSEKEIEKIMSNLARELARRAFDDVAERWISTMTGR